MYVDYYVDDVRRWFRIADTKLAFILRPLQKVPRIENVCPPV